MKVNDKVRIVKHVTIDSSYIERPDLVGKEAVIILEAEAPFDWEILIIDTAEIVLALSEELVPITRLSIEIKDEAKHIIDKVLELA